ncbi:hypothetical protein H6P81_000069 [Aristolochia fimbriata]|uniref:Uncharacterized protein n=1 Tax=Aristolochia fimbriata TaxID=158543 RepID=A0AAV7F606_ARIFI|nr:hypothetical protein H6P81_000069 [Aristolochia fimbriata]
MALLFLILNATRSYAFAASTAVSKVPSQTLDPLRPGSRISAANFPLPHPAGMNLLSRRSRFRLRHRRGFRLRHRLAPIHFGHQRGLWEGNFRRSDKLEGDAGDFFTGATGKFGRRHVLGNLVIPVRAVEIIRAVGFEAAGEEEAEELHNIMSSLVHRMCEQFRDLHGDEDLDDGRGGPFDHCKSCLYEKAESEKADVCGLTEMLFNCAVSALASALQITTQLIDDDYPTDDPRRDPLERYVVVFRTSREIMNNAYPYFHRLPGLHLGLRLDRGRAGGTTPTHNGIRRSLQRDLARHCRLALQYLVYYSKARRTTRSTKHEYDPHHLCSSSLL